MRGLAGSSLPPFGLDGQKYIGPSLCVSGQLCGSTETAGGWGLLLLATGIVSPPPGPLTEEAAREKETIKPPNSANSRTVNISQHLSRRARAAASCCPVYLTVSPAFPPALCVSL